MKQAIKQAEIAYNNNEVPVGAVIVYKNKIISKASNQQETLNDPTAHAEMIAITSATNYNGGKYLKECVLYVTIEPCVMCAGATYWAQIGKIVFGSADTKKGFRIFNKNILHPSTKIYGGILKNECNLLMKKFFKKLRL